MAITRKKTQKKSQKKAPKKNTRLAKSAHTKSPVSRPGNPSRQDMGPKHSAHPVPVQPVSRLEHHGPSLPIRTIDGETTIGDLIVAFPRTRDILMKHGLRFDVEEAGYLYMTLSVFSAIHGHSTNSLVEQLVVISKEPPLPPAMVPLRPVAATPTN